MIWLFFGLGAILVIAIAVVAVGIALGRLEHENVPAVYELEDALEYVAENLPDEVTARLTYDDVRAVLRWHLDWFGDVGLATDYGEELGDEAVAEGDQVVAAEDAAVEAVVARSLAEAGPEPIDVVCILDLQMRYLAEIGALGPEPGDDVGRQ